MNFNILITVSILELVMSSETFSKKYGETASLKLSRVNLIFPGTKWCGPGNIAKDNNELGTYAETDACCREHDMCPEVVAAGQTIHDLVNDASYSRVHCKCDEKFFKCLKSSKDESSSTMIGFIYFNVLNTKCFMEDHPIVQCAQRSYNSYSGNYRCEEYATNGTAPIKWQWFDVPTFP